MAIPLEVGRRITSYIDQASDMVGSGDLMLEGSSVHFDKRWLSRKFSPSLFIPLHHRIMDVSAVRELARHANPELFVNEPTPTTDHRAQHCLDDSIALFRYYWRAIGRCTADDGHDGGTGGTVNLSPGTER